jgi:spore coat polysaccharide biosynthesis predicted glycosyltransferase SpsG
MFKVLIIAYYFPPLGLSGVQRTLKFAKYLSKYNWEPTVITTGDVGYFAHDFSLLKEAENAQIKIIRTSGLHPNAVVNSYKKNKMPNELLRKVLNRISQTIFIPDNKIF